jgi:hypothetical protein
MASTSIVRSQSANNCLIMICICRDGKDLNRVFPERHENGGNLTATGSEPAEVTSIMRLGTSLPFAAGANLHEGAVVVSYPWDGVKGKEQKYGGSPDDSAYVRLAKSFAANHAWMKDQVGQPAGGHKGIRVRVSSYRSLAKH